MEPTISEAIREQRTRNFVPTAYGQTRATAANWTGPYSGAQPMTEITSFVALPFDFIDGGITAGEPIACPSPTAAIERAQGLWRVFGRAGSVAFSRTTDFEIGKFNNKHVLRRFGHVADEYR